MFTFTVSCANLNVIADFTTPDACAIAAGISAGEGGASSILPYLTKVAKRGFAYSVIETLAN